MKKTTLLVLSILMSLSICAQDISGKWNGTLNIQGTQLRVVFNISQTDKGYSTKMDSPDQGAKNIPVTTTEFEKSVLNLAVGAAIQYTATLDKEGVFVGTFKQAGQDKNAAQAQPFVSRM